MKSTGGGISGVNWAPIALQTAVATLACAAGALVVTYLLHQLFGRPEMHVQMTGAAVIAGLVAAAFSILLGLKQQELAKLKQKLNQTNSVDSLTLCLDGQVFSALVDSYQTHAGPAGQGRRGAFLIVDADRFKTINERFGHAWGDEALRAISAAIKSCLRSGDLVGRIGGEEFGVFLPGATENNAAHVAERIRSVISETLFEPGGAQCGLTVSVGAVVFESQLAFDDLFRAADAVLATAKNEGRNRTKVERLSLAPSARRGGETPRQTAH